MITMVGAGFVGSILFTEYVRLAFAGQLWHPFHIIDDDTLERRNCANQNFELREATKAVPKAQALANWGSRNEVDTKWTRKRVTASNIAVLMKDTTCIIDAVDNLDTRQLLHQYGLKIGVPVLHIGVAADGHGKIEWSQRGHDTFSLAAHRLIGKPMPTDPESGSTPPCELVRLRGVGLNLGLAGARALAIYLGFDPMEYFPPGDAKGWFTNWAASPYGHEPIKELWHGPQSQKEEA